mmetsp:Transcript_38299/g.95928  ORF Transcript_38299/g.95928 Transcript_38299/m.95928 type:complete len:263 (-) Transcript_38299:1940-2728(-)
MACVSRRVGRVLLQLGAPNECRPHGRLIYLRLPLAESLLSLLFVGFGHHALQNGPPASLNDDSRGLLTLQLQQQTLAERLLQDATLDQFDVLGSVLPVLVWPHHGPHASGIDHSLVTGGKRQLSDSWLVDGRPVLGIRPSFRADMFDDAFAGRQLTADDELRERHIAEPRHGLVGDQPGVYCFFGFRRAPRLFDQVVQRLHRLVHTTAQLRVFCGGRIHGDRACLCDLLGSHSFDAGEALGPPLGRLMHQLMTDRPESAQLL